jgi:hypothetical protein
MGNDQEQIMPASQQKTKIAVAATKDTATG